MSILRETLVWKTNDFVSLEHAKFLLQSRVAGQAGQAELGRYLVLAANCLAYFDGEDRIGGKLRRSRVGL